MTKALCALAAALLLTLAALPAQAQQVRQLLNALRSEAGLGPVTPSPRLEAAAMAHALDMAANSFFSHRGSDGSSTGDRTRRAGYDYCAIAENIARGQSNPAEVLGAWAQSGSHRRNLLAANVTDYGLVRAPGDIWVLLLGRDGCDGNSR